MEDGTVTFTTNTGVTETTACELRDLLDRLADKTLALTTTPRTDRARRDELNDASRLCSSRQERCVGSLSARVAEAALASVPATVSAIGVLPPSTRDRVPRHEACRRRGSRRASAALAGAALGFGVGLVLDAIVGAVGLLGLHGLVGIRFLPLLTAGVGAVVVVIPRSTARRFPRG